MRRPAPQRPTPSVASLRWSRCRSTPPPCTPTPPWLRSTAWWTMARARSRYEWCHWSSWRFALTGELRGRAVANQNVSWLPDLACWEWRQGSSGSCPLRSLLWWRLLHHPLQLQTGRPRAAHHIHLVRKKADVCKQVAALWSIMYTKPSQFKTTWHSSCV